MKHTILITGATGAIGSAFIEDERVLTFETYALVRQPNKHLPKHINQILWDESFLTEELKSLQFNYVFHFAGYTSFSDDIDSVSSLIQANVLFGSQILASLDFSHLKAFINTTSAMINDHNNIYAVSKKQFELSLRYFSDRYSFPVVNCIVHNVYGVKNRKKKILDYLIEALDKEVSASPGEQVIDFIHIDDIKEAFFQTVRAFNLGKKPNQTLILGSGQGHSLKSLAQKIEKITNRKILVNWGELPYTKHQNMWNVADLSQNENSEIGWYPKTSLEDGLAKVLKTL